MTNTLNKIIHNGDEYEFPGIPNDTTGTTSIVSNIWAGTSSEYNLITPKEGQLSIVLHEEGGGGWQPGANTVAYYPLTEDFNDYSGNGYDLTNNSAQITTLDGVKCCDLNSSYASANFVISTLPYTITFWSKARVSGGAGMSSVLFNDTPHQRGGQGLFFRSANTVGIRYGNPTNTYDEISYTIDTDWHLYAGVWSSSGFVLYIDGQYYAQPKNSLSDPTNSGTPLRMGANEVGAIEFANGYIGGVVLEDKARTSQEVSDYYDLTKGDYGIS